MAASRNSNMQHKLKLLIRLGWGSFTNKGALLHSCLCCADTVWRDMTGKRFLSKSDNIQMSFALSPKKQEILATLMPKDKVLKKMSCRDKGFWEPQELFL